MITFSSSLGSPHTSITVYITLYGEYYLSPCSIMGFLPKANQRQKTTMDLYLSAVEEVAETWQTLKAIANYEEVVGVLLFRQ